MGTKHTPGPWLVGDLDHAGQRVVRQQHIEICTCWHHSVGSIEQEMEANGRLIAAAPDLLSIVKRFVALPSAAWFPERHAAEEALLVEEARAALSKAEPTS